MHTLSAQLGGKLIFSICQVRHWRLRNADLQGGTPHVTPGTCNGSMRMLSEGPKSSQKFPTCIQEGSLWKFPI